MPFNIGTNAVKKAYRGATEVKKIFSGTSLVWQSFLKEFDVFAGSKIYRFNTETNTETLSTAITGYTTDYYSNSIYYNDDYYYLVSSYSRRVTVVDKENLSVVETHQLSGSTSSPSSHTPSFIKLNSKYIIAPVVNSNGGFYRLDVSTMTSAYAHYGAQYSTKNIDDNVYSRSMWSTATILAHSAFPSISTATSTTLYTGIPIYENNYLYTYGKRSSTGSSTEYLQKIDLTSGNYESSLVLTDVKLTSLMSSSSLSRDGDYLFLYRDYTMVQPSTSKIYIWHISQLESLSTTNYYARVNVEYTLKSKPEIVGDELYFYEYSTATESTSLRRYTFGAGDLTLIATYTPSVSIGSGYRGYAIANKIK